MLELRWVSGRLSCWRSDERPIEPDVANDSAEFKRSEKFVSRISGEKRPGSKCGDASVGVPLKSSVRNVSRKPA